MGVHIGRTTGTAETYAFIEDETVEELIKRANLSLSEKDEVTDEFGDNVEISSLVENGGEYWVSTNYKNGFN